MHNNIFLLDNSILDATLSDVKELFDAHEPYTLIPALEGKTVKLETHFTDNVLDALYKNDMTKISTSELRIIRQFVEWQNYLLSNNVLAGSEEDLYVSTTNEKPVLIELNNWLINEIAKQSEENSTVQEA